MKKLLQTLTETFGPSGYEDEVREIVRGEVESLADEIRVDTLGNLIARKRPTKATRDTRKIMIADPRVVRWMIGTAEKNKLPYQREVLLIGGTDARAIQLTRAGVPAGCISVPVRYVHSLSEMVDVSDVQNAVKLLTAVLRTPIDL